MKYVDEFRNADLARAVSAEISSLVDPKRHYKIMEVCGGHTHTIYRHGIKDLLPDQVELVHGPGCPVCVLPMGRVDEGIAIAERPEVIFTCFGDMMRVPGSKGNLLEVKAEGADIRMVYSPLGRPADRAREPRPRSRLLRHRVRDHGPFHGAHVAAGEEGGHRELLRVLQPRHHRAAGACAPGLAGSAPRRLHRAWARLDGDRVPPLRVHARRLRQAVRGGGVRAAGPHAVRPDAHTPARRGPLRGREPVRPGRPLGGEPQGPPGHVRGLRTTPILRMARARLHRPVRPEALPAYADLDAELRYSTPGVRVADPKACQCGEVLKGVLKPPECKVFGTACTPERPLGALMVSSEGACAAYYNFGRKSFEKVEIGSR